LNRRTYFALALSLVGIVGLAILPSWLAPKRREPVAKTPEPPPVTPTVTETASDPPPAPEPVARLLRAYTSLFKTAEKDGRVANIELGAAKLNGSVIEPGAEWSFNETVGPRTKERGFKEAPTYLMGEVIPALGGGMCQVSSTVHAAALLTGFEIVKRQPHSRPSSYIERGLDATVNYPKHCWKGKQDPNTCFDLRVRNPYDFPITIKTLVHDPVTPTKVPKRALTVELRGTGKVAHVMIRWKLYSTPPFKQKWRRLTWKKGDWKKKKQNGRNGANGGLSVLYGWPDGRDEVKVFYSKYAPVNEVWYVGNDWPEGVNPWE
jgi:hypothetical protein